MEIFRKIVEYFSNICYLISGIKDNYRSKIMKNEYSALDIATWFIYKNNAMKKEIQVDNEDYEVYEDLTHLKLQKLLYYAQGISLAKYGCPLFKEAIEAWEHGPVIKRVFEIFKDKGRCELKLEDAPCSALVIRKIETDTKARDVLNMTYDNFAIYTAWQLRNMTHEVGSPWYNTYVQNKNKKIDNTLIMEYFKREILE